MNTKRKSSSRLTEHKCEFCGKKYKREAAFLTHLSNCEKKKRLESIDQPEVIESFKLWKLCTSKSKKIKDFVVSRDYNLFLKLNSDLDTLNVEDKENFIIWLIDNRIAMTNWAKPSYHKKYIRMKILSEHPRDAIMRSVSFIDNSGFYGRFMNEYPVGQFLNNVENGKLSPWVLFLFPNASNFFVRIREDQLDFFSQVVNIDVWLNKARRYQKSVESLKSELKGIHI